MNTPMMLPNKLNKFNGMVQGLTIPLDSVTLCQKQSQKSRKENGVSVIKSQTVKGDETSNSGFKPSSVVKVSKKTLKKLREPQKLQQALANASELNQNLSFVGISKRNRF